MKESTQAIEAWNVYLNLGPDRSLRLVSENLGKDISLIKEWSRHHKWQDRIRVHERKISEEAQRKNAEKRLKDIEEARHERKLVAKILRTKAMKYFEGKELEQVLDKESGKVRKGVDVTRAHLALKMLEHADKSERLDMGEATDRTASEQTDWAKLLDQIENEAPELGEDE